MRIRTLGWLVLLCLGAGLDARAAKLILNEYNAVSAANVLEGGGADAVFRPAGTIIPVAEDVATNVSYDPAGGDWWINVQAIDAGPSTYVTPNSFPVSNDNWQLTI